LVRSPLAFAAIVAAVFLAGCNPDGMREVNGRHMQPLSGKMLAEIESKNMEKESPILVRIFKQESEFEVWKEDKTGRFALLRTYPICRWSGELGPKIKTGDRQAPEGFYTITPGQMNPNSSYYLAFNIGFPNAYDRANGYTGAFLMVHGDCLSAGCYAMTDEQIAEIYALARESFLGGQKSFQIQAYPFRMTPLNLAKHRNSPHIAFWKMLKQGYDHFEVTRLEPKVNVCEKRYVFGAETSGKFNAAERCPAYNVPGDIATDVQNKQRRDDVKIAELVNRGTPAVPVKTGVDGGMNPTFLTAMKLNGGPGVTIRTAAGTIPNHVSPPAEDSTAKPFSFASTESKPVSGPRSSVQVASAAPSSAGGIGGFFSNLFGSKDDGSQAASEAAPKAKAAPAKSTKTVAASTPKSEPKTESRQPAETKTASAAPTKPQAVQPSRQEADADPQQSKPTAVTDLLNGASPTVPSGGFNGRFGVSR
jgi:murein L,D-transpeptidase YafK